MSATYIPPSKGKPHGLMRPKKQGIIGERVRSLDEFNQLSGGSLWVGRLRMARPVAFLRSMTFEMVSNYLREGLYHYTPASKRSDET